jgi:hypothetical protein
MVMIVMVRMVVVTVIVMVRMMVVTGEGGDDSFDSDGGCDSHSDGELESDGCDRRRW